MPEKERWISWEFLLKRWAIEPSAVYHCIVEGLSCYDRDRIIIHWEDGCEETPPNTSRWTMLRDSKLSIRIYLNMGTPALTPKKNGS